MRLLIVGDLIIYGISKMMNGNEKVRKYRNTYFVIGMDGTEIIQSQAVRTEPCP